jgi:hypothetical protein
MATWLFVGPRDQRLPGASKGANQYDTMAREIFPDL